jgi:CRP/FNR family transcriptional regulator, cyclic AMP receptor protein
MTMRPHTAEEPRWLPQFLSFCQTHDYVKNVDVIRVGEPADNLYYLIEGSVAVLLDDQERHELVLAYLFKGDFIGEMGLFVPQIPQETRHVNVRTRTRCRIAEISYQHLDQLLDQELKPLAKEFLYAIGSQLSKRLRQTFRKVEGLAFLDVAARIRGTLLDLCTQPDALTHPDGTQIRISRQELGRIVGCSREMAGRVLKNLEEQGLVRVKGMTIVVLGTR